MKRIITGIVLGVLFILSLFGGGIYWLLFVLLVVLIGSLEFSGIFFRGKLLALKMLTIGGTLIFPINKYLHIIDAFSVPETFIIAMLFVLAPTVFMLNRGAVEDFIISVPMAIIGPLWVGYLMSYTIPLYHMSIDGLPRGVEIVFLLAFLVTGNDIGAYYIGRDFGKKPLSPIYSPQKTWEGAFGGLLMAMANGALVHYCFLQRFPLEHILILAVLVVVAGSFGDLFASVFKRSCKVKDAGGILPGHGGIFDRMDSFAFATPVYYWYLYYFVAS